MAIKFYIAVIMSYLCTDYAFVDSQQPDLPYHICVIRDFKLVSYLRNVFSFALLASYHLACEFVQPLSPIVIVKLTLQTVHV